MSKIILAFTDKGLIMADAADGLLSAQIMAMGDAGRAAVVALDLANGAVPAVTMTKNVADVLKFWEIVKASDIDNFFKESFAAAIGGLAGIAALPAGPAAALAADQLFSKYAGDFWQGVYDISAQYSLYDFIEEMKTPDKRGSVTVSDVEPIYSKTATSTHIFERWYHPPGVLVYEIVTAIETSPPAPTPEDDPDYVPGEPIDPPPPREGEWTIDDPVPVDPPPDEPIDPPPGTEAYGGNAFASVSSRSKTTLASESIDQEQVLGLASEIGYSFDPIGSFLTTVSAIDSFDTTTSVADASEKLVHSSTMQSASLLGAAEAQFIGFGSTPISASELDKNRQQSVAPLAAI